MQDYRPINYDRSLLTFDPPHIHRYNGKRLLGVTTALSAISKGDGLTQWAVNQALGYARQNLSILNESCQALNPPVQLAPEDVELILTGAKFAWRNARDEAASVGTQAHNWIEQYLRGEDPPWPDSDPVKRACEAALEWIRGVSWETIKVEHQIYLPELEVAGICDWYARINGVLAVPDWKTSKQLHSTYAYQTAAYAKALEEEFGKPIPHRWLIRIDKETGACEPRLLDTGLDEDFETFKSAVTIYRREAELKKLWTTGNGS